MKKVIPIFLIFSVMQMNAQKTDKKKSDYAPVEITKVDGSKMKIYVKKITISNIKQF